MQKIIPPTNCPSCESELVWKKDLLYCTNNTCGVKSKKAVEHWAKTLKIKGLGPQSIEKLGLNSILDIYDLTPESIKTALGSEKIAEKLYAEIENSKNVNLNTALPGFNIPLIGKTASDKLCKVINHIDELTFEAAKKAGLGPKATDNLLLWFNTTYIIELQGILPIELKSEETQSNGQGSLGTVCISGKLKSFKTKADAEKVLTELGYKVKSSLTKDVTILVNESGIESAKTSKARNSGVTIIDNIKQLIGE